MQDPDRASSSAKQYGKAEAQRALRYTHTHTHTHTGTHTKASRWKCRKLFLPYSLCQSSKNVHNIFYLLLRKIKHLKHPNGYQSLCLLLTIVVFVKPYLVPPVYSVFQVMKHCVVLARIAVHQEPCQSHGDPRQHGPPGLCHWRPHERARHRVDEGRGEAV